MRLQYLKNYFTLFLTTFSVILLTKFIFLYYLEDNFLEFNTYDLVYAIFWGYKFDFAASALVAFFASWFDFNKKLFSFISSLMIVSIFLLQIGDILYFNESSRHIGYEITDTLTDAYGLFMTAYSQHTAITILSLCMSIILFIFFIKLFYITKTTLFDKFYLPKKILLVLITVFFIRGMIQGIPLNPWQSNQIGNYKLASLALNPTYNVLYSLVNKKKKLQKEKIKELDKTVILKSFRELYPEEIQSNNLPIITTKPNIVFLFLESWSAKFMKPYGFEKSTTPYFDELLQKSVRPTAMMANGHRTTEGLFAALTSLQNPLGKSVAKTQLQSHQYSSIIDELNKNNYSSSFFQGSSKETSGTGSLANNLGFKYSFGKKDIKKRIYEENYWGVQDPDLYNFVIKKVDTLLKEPFVLGINGATTHDSIVPDDFEKKEFSKKEKLNDKLNAFHFSDFALKKFINEFEEKYPNTVFVLFADHCGGKLSGIFDNYMIPFAIYSKKLIKPKHFDVYLSQRDIAPTIYDLTIGSYKTTMSNFSGKSLFSDKKFFADYFHNGILGWIEEKDIVELNTATQEQECFKIVNFSKVKTQCSPKHDSMNTRALSFTNISQELLFSGKSSEFHTYRNRDK